MGFAMTHCKQYWQEVEKFVSHWTNSGFEKFHDEFCDSVLPAIDFSGELTDDRLIPVGSSKLGGRPDLADPGIWPMTKAGRPLIFRAQVNLAELSGFEIGRELPKNGLLSFFYETDYDEGNLVGFAIGCNRDESDRWRVLYQPNIVELIRIEFPYSLPEYVHGSPAKLIPRRVLTMADETSSKIQRLELDPDEKWKFVETSLSSPYNKPSRYRARLLGNPEVIQNDIFSFFHAVASRLDPSSPENFGPEISEGAEEWRLLFQLNAWYETDAADFRGEGTIYFGIRRTELENLDFNRVMLVWQA